MPTSFGSSKKQEGSGPRVLLKSGPGNRGRSACGPTHVARLEFPRALEKEMATHSNVLAWKILRTKEPGELQSMGSQRVGHN